jgi:hypothetical protein
MSNAYPTLTAVMANAMKIGFTGRDGVATSCQWLDPQPQGPAVAVLKHDERDAVRLERHARRLTPTRQTAASNPRPSSVCRPTFSRGG